MESLWELLSGISWLAIFTMLICGAALSYIGDRVGMKFAKRRVSLFGLRPRYTSSLITAVTGMVISLGAMIVMSVLSDSVRTALFSMQFLQGQLTTLTQQLQESRDERELLSFQVVDAQTRLYQTQRDLANREAELVEQEAALEELTSDLETMQGDLDDLRSERQQLQQETQRIQQDLDRMRTTLGRFQEGRIVAFADELLAQTVVPQGSSAEAVRAMVLRLNERVRYEVAQRSQGETSQVQLVVAPDEIQRVLDRCLAVDSRKVLQAMVLANVVAGEPVELHYRVFESTRVFDQGEELLSRQISTAMDSATAETLLGLMLRELNHTASAAGVEGDPLTGMVGDISANEFFDAVETITRAGDSFWVRIYAAADIYTEGPVQVHIEIQGEER